MQSLEYRVALWGLRSLLESECAGECKESGTTTTR
jgi:hypothetical protein